MILWRRYGRWEDGGWITECRRKATGTEKVLTMILLVFRLSREREQKVILGLSVITLSRRQIDLTVACPPLNLSPPLNQVWVSPYVFSSRRTFLFTPHWLATYFSPFKKLSFNSTSSTKCASSELLEVIWPSCELPKPLNPVPNLSHVYSQGKVPSSCVHRLAPPFLNNSYCLTEISSWGWWDLRWFLHIGWTIYVW